ncbi:hypothetical protein EDD37DRAFT_407183 [Exophiala viscosa]|uniref:Uncharacterized protein n=1 Tax=Exophiala viscosa TaxID=2486360 RepID=A0AAN6IES9_9EURO|nr:hypothetical protein EDD36DRAFT_416335 [Exophiala viscosa]KAI1624308.1 hypothetical protein EDD37DRAFT_407183 [Exophiala viscosa]
MSHHHKTNSRPAEPHAHDLRSRQHFALAGKSRMVSLKIRTGENIIDGENSSFNNYDISQPLISRIEQLIPARYKSPPHSKSRIFAALEDAISFVHNTCPAGLKRGNLPRADTLSEKCRLLGSFIPIPYFPPSGRPVDRFLGGLITYLEDQNTRGVTAPSPVDTPQSGAAASKTDARQPPIAESGPGRAQLPTPPTLGTDEISAIKIESDTETGTPKGLRKQSRKKGSSTRQLSSAAKRRKRREAANLERDAADDNTRRPPTHPKKKKAKAFLHHRASSPVLDLTPQPPQIDVASVSAQLRDRLNVTPKERPSRNGQSSDSESSEESDSSSDSDSRPVVANPAGARKEEQQRELHRAKRRKPLNVYRAMYDEAQEEIRFLQDLLMKGAGLTEADLKACKVRVKNGRGFKYAFDLVYNPDVDDRGKEPPRKKVRVSL